MAEFSRYLEDALINATLRATSYTSPANIHIALSTATIVDTTTGSTIVEPASNYGRDDMGAAASAFDPPSAGATANTNTDTFVQASGNWGTITDMALCDAATTGNILYYTPVDTPKAINTDDTAEFAAGAITVTLD